MALECLYYVTAVLQEWCKVYFFSIFYQSGDVYKDGNGYKWSVQGACLHSSCSWDQSFIETRSRETSLCQHPMLTHQRYCCRIPDPPHGLKLSSRIHHWWGAAQAGPPVVRRHSREGLCSRGHDQHHPEHCSEVCGLGHPPVFTNL